MSDINIVPLVDVVLVLLVIFMITAPMLSRGIDIDLPRSSVNTIKATDRIMLTVSRDHTVMVNDEKVPLSELSKALEEIRMQSPNAAVYLRGDEKVSYGIIVQVMDAIKKVGIEKLGMVTEPARNRRS